MGGGVDEIGEGDQRGGEPDHGAVERGHQDLRVAVEGRRHVEVVDHEPSHERPSGVVGDVARVVVAEPGDLHVGAAAGIGQRVENGPGRALGGGRGARHLRREIPPFARQDRDVDVFSGGDLTHHACEPVVQVLGQGVEFLGEVERDDGDDAADFEEDFIVRGGRRHCRGDFGKRARTSEED